MGLDGVEVVMAVEEEFKITLADEEVFQAPTVGKLVGVVLSRLQQGPNLPCISQHGFYRVRQVLMQQLEIRRNEITPNCLLATLIAKPGRQQIWQKLLEAITGSKEQVQMVGLVRPRWLSQTVFLALPLLTIVLFCFWLPIKMWFFAFFPGLIVAYIGGVATRVFQSDFPYEYSYVKDLIRLVTSLNSRTWTHDEVFEKIRDIAVDILGVDQHQVTMDARWIEDLGVG